MKIVCATDFSDASMAALEWATTLAKESDAELTLCHVRDGVELTRGVSVGGRPARGQLERLAKRTGEKLGRSVRWAVIEGKPAHVRLAEYANGENALLVLGTVGKSGLERILVGSVAEAVVRLGKCPVLLVPPS